MSSFRDVKGFTLIELMVSLAISTLLLVSVMGLSARLSQAAKIIREKHPTRQWQEILSARLQVDYRNARSIVVRPNEIVIDGVGLSNSRAVDEKFPLLKPVRIIYSIRSTDQYSVLLRTERPLLGTQEVESRFLATGVNGFRTKQSLATDVAPGILGLELYLQSESVPLRFQLVRHGVPE